MADAKLRTDWDRAATVLSFMAHGKVSPADLNPYRQTVSQEPIHIDKKQTREALKSFAAMFRKGKR